MGLPASNQFSQRNRVTCFFSILERAFTPTNNLGICVWHLGTLAKGVRDCGDTLSYDLVSPGEPDDFGDYLAVGICDVAEFRQTLAVSQRIVPSRERLVQRRAESRRRGCDG